MLVTGISDDSSHAKESLPPHISPRVFPSLCPPACTQACGTSIDRSAVADSVRHNLLALQKTIAPPCVATQIPDRTLPLTWGIAACEAEKQAQIAIEGTSVKDD